MTITFHDGKDLSLLYLDEEFNIVNKKMLDFFEE
jgi:hypothetical protein